MLDSIAKSYGKYNSNISHPKDIVKKIIQFVVINLPMKDHIRK
tara:strand:+ start:678 stop:806 length:129 start_codon:yes stop_codon:yes gene_type:complete